MSTEEGHRHAVDEAWWRAFADRHGLTMFWHTHGALPGAHGEIDGLRVSLCGRMTGVELIGTRALPATCEFALWDGSFAEWCRASSRVEVAEAGHASVAKRLHLPPPSPATLAYLLPHRYAGVAAASGDTTLDERFRVLPQNEPLGLAPQAIQALLRLPSPAQMAAFAGDLRAFFPGEPMSDGLFAAFQAVWRAIGHV